MSARSRDLLSAALIGAGIMGAGELYYACAASTNADGSYWKDWFDSEKYFTGSCCLQNAHSAMQSGRNDTLFIGSAAGITSTTSITWSNNLCHVVGMQPSWPGWRQHRSRLDVTDADASPVITISGYGNMFANMSFKHANASTAGVNLVTVSGARNYFKNVHFNLYDSSMGTVAAYSLVKLGDCSEVGFEGCFFGEDSVTISSGQLLEYTSNTTIRAMYQNCNFMMVAGNAAALFIHVKGGAGRGSSIFKNCLFINNSATAITEGINSTGLVNTGHQFYFDAGCNFAGVTDICSAGTEAYVLFGGSYFSTGNVENVYLGHMLAIDHTSG